MTNERFPPWPPIGTPFPESTSDSTGAGQPDFPGSQGDRERGRFRPSRRPRLTTVAVVNDDGSPVGSAVVALDDHLLELRAIRIGIQRLLAALVEDDVDLLDLAQMAESEDVI